ncbi:MAG: hypothetical protein R3F02_07010 [Thiolinea sp.]
MRANSSIRLDSYSRKFRYLSGIIVLASGAILISYLVQPDTGYVKAPPASDLRSFAVVRLAGADKAAGSEQPVPQVTDARIPAFPGAQGDGAASRGGRGGKTLIVDRLDDPCPTKACTTEDLASAALATPGTLRWALLQNFPRTIVFRVSGIIRLQEDLVELIDGQQHVKRLGIIRIRNPYLTVAGQTAPAGGITIAGNGVSIETHDVVLRYLRFRTGRGKQAFFKDQQNPETLMIGNGAREVMVDHCSFSWMPAEGVSVYTGESYDGSTGTAGNITLSWNIIGEGLIQHKDGRGHPNGAFMSGFDGAEHYAARNITLHHNLFVHTQKRNGDLLSYNGRLVNNLFYNWQWLPTVIAGGVEADIIGNIWKPGPMTGIKEGDTQGVHLVPAASELEGADAQDWWRAVSGAPSLFLSGNAFGSAQQVLLNQQDVLCYYRSRNESCREEIPDSRWFRQAAMTPAEHAVLHDAVNTAEQRVLQQAGASQRVNLSGKWVANRDAVDERYVSEYRDTTYLLERFPWHEQQVGGYPQQIEGAPYPDRDRDGMSDLWEVQNGLNPADANDAQLPAKNGGGYTNLEVFIH